MEHIILASKIMKHGEEIKTVEVSRHIGNAVPPKLGLVIGEKIVEHIEENYVR
jgi:site-specific DNA-cytosine methylase